MSRLLAERYLTELVEPCGALPRKCLFIYLLSCGLSGGFFLDACFPLGITLQIQLSGGGSFSGLFVFIRL
jgi:hypothetical protein